MALTLLSSPLLALYKIKTAICNLHFIKKIVAISKILSSKNYLTIKKVFSKILWHFLSISCVPLAFTIVLLCRLFRPILLIRFDLAVSERIGHFAGNMELYVLERKAGINIPTKRVFDFWGFNHPVSNVQLARMWKRVLNVVPGCIIAPMIRINAIIPGGRIHQIGKNKSHDRDVYNLLDKFPPTLSFTHEELSLGEDELRSLGVPLGNPFVCLNVRDSTYLRAQLPWWNWDYHSYRDCDIQNYEKAADALTKLGYYVIRMGALVSEAMDTKNPMVIDYAASGARTDFMDIYLGAHCVFCISNGTGFDAIPYIFRRPIVFVDHTPPGIFHTYSERFMATTKRYWLRAEGREMSLEEILASDAATYFNTNAFEGAGIEVEESSPEEILEVVLEMEGRLSGTWVSDDRDEELQKYFWSIYPKDNGYHAEIRSRVGSHFIRNRADFKGARAYKIYGPQVNS